MTPKTPKFNLGPVPTDELVSELLKRDGVTYHATDMKDEPWCVTRSNWVAQQGTGRVQILVVVSP